MIIPATTPPIAPPITPEEVELSDTGAGPGGTTVKKDTCNIDVNVHTCGIQTYTLHILYIHVHTSILTNIPT